MIKLSAWLGFVLAGMLLAAPINAYADDQIPQGGACKPMKEGLHRLIAIAQSVNGKVAAVAPANMDTFKTALGEDGKDIDGEAAIILLLPEGKMMVFVKRGDQLCLVKIFDKIPDGLNSPASGGSSEPKVEERGA